MKKHFLLIVLFAVMFLGLGNYSYACDASAIATYVSCVAANNGELGSCVLPSDVIGCTQAECPASCGIFNPSNGMCTLDCITVAPQPSTDPTVAERTQKCPTATVTIDNVGYVNKDVDGNCCSQGGEVPGLSTCDPSKLTENQPGVPCNPPSGGNLNAMGFCACPTGTKNVNGTCTSCKAEGVCCGISLNTSIPFIGNCIEDSVANKGPGETDVTGTTAFPTLMGSLTKILVTVILIVSFVLIIVGGIMIATGNPSGGKKMIINVVIGIALLGASGVILRLINPNFFG